jgi:ABC-type nickel/cobalt efflux system permease component RcnA
MRRYPLTRTALFPALALVLVLAVPTVVVAAEPGASNGSTWNQLIAWIFEQQRAFHRQLTGSLQALQADGGIRAAGALILASFLYGVFHAAGPGHGKAVIGTYLLTHRERLRRGVMLAVAAAFCQGLVAIVLVYGLIYLAGWLPRETSSAVGWSERLSYLFVAALGVFLLWRAGAAVLVQAKHRLSSRSLSAHDHQCDHTHGPTVGQIEQAGDLRSSLGVVLAIGIRPCTGAIIVLVFAKAIDLAWAGIGAVVAMSVGTALAVSILALLAVSLRSQIAGRAGRLTDSWHVTASAIKLAGGVTLAVIGFSLLAASFKPQHPLSLY